MAGRILAWKTTEDYFAKLIAHNGNFHWKIENIRNPHNINKYRSALKAELEKNIHRLNDYIKESNDNSWSHQEALNFPRFFSSQFNQTGINSINRADYQNQWMNKQCDELTDYYIRQSLRNSKILIGLSGDMIPDEIIEMQRKKILAKRSLKKYNRFRNDKRDM